MKPSFRHIVLQPTTGCNLDCGYCYLPGRHSARRMPVEVACAVAESVNAVPQSIVLLWHGGEPLSCGLQHFTALVEQFEDLRRRGRVRHSLQTNGTLITREWCEAFERFGFTVGVSVDGPEPLNSTRTTWGGAPSHAAAVRGASLLRASGIRFGAIAVVSRANCGEPERLYNFFVSLGCTQLHINIEEREGMNRAAPGLTEEEVARFWRELFEVWRSKPALRIREFQSVLGWLLGTSESQRRSEEPSADFWPTVAYNGDVVVLSPEFVATNELERPRFVIGNVLASPLNAIVERSFHKTYVREFFAGLRACRSECEYYSYCGGGQASNKYFERGTTAATETVHCRHTRQALVDALLESLLGEPSRGSEKGEFG